MNSLKNFLGYLFDGTPGKEFKFYTISLILIGILIVLSIAFSIIYKKKKKEDFAFKRLFKKTANRLFLFGLLFLILIGLRYENIPYFAMRIWPYLGIILFLYFAFITIKAYKVDYPREKENTRHMVKTETEEVKKYLPNKKR